MSIFDKIMPTHAAVLKVAKKAAASPANGRSKVGEDRIELALRYVAAAIEDKDWTNARKATAKLAHELTMKINEEGADDAGVVRKPRRD